MGWQYTPSGCQCPTGALTQTWHTHLQLSFARLIFREYPSKWVDHCPCNALCRDVEPDERLCAACNIKKDFVLQLRGACKDSLLGIFIALRFSKFSKTKFSFRLQIPDSECGVLCWFEWMDFNDNQAKISTLKPFFLLQGTATSAPNGRLRAQRNRISWQFQKRRSKRFCLEPNHGPLRTTVTSVH